MDGLTLDGDDDALRELGLHGGVGFEATATKPQLLAVAFANGRRAVLGTDDGGAVTPGQSADLVALDWAEVDDDRLREDVDPIDLLLARSRREHVHTLVVAGRTVVAEGRLTGIDVRPLRDGMLERIRAEVRDNEALRAALPLLERQLDAVHRVCADCC